MLKTDNYVYKDYAPRKAIAKISEFIIHENGYTVAIFDIKSSRDGEVLERVKVPFEWIRNQNIAETAYNTAKGMKVEMVWDEETHQEVEKEVPNVFYGWEDDIKYYED